MRILLIVHGFPPAAGGGTEVYVHDLAIALASGRDDEVVVLTREADPRRPELHVRRFTRRGVRVIAINNRFQACASFEESYTQPALRAIARDLIASIAPDVAHVQHLTCLSIGILEDLASCGIPVVMTLNDYWLICHRGQLIDRDGARCDGPFDGGCGRCLPAGLFGGTAAYRAGRIARALPISGAGRAVRIAARAAEAATSARRTRQASERRLGQMREAARHVDVCLAPSKTLAERFRRFGVRDLRLCDQGIDLAPFEGLARDASAVLRVAFAGSLIPSKGAHVLLDAVARLPVGTVAVDLIGAPAAYHGEEAYAASIRARVGHPAVRRLGAIPHERMAAALGAADVVVVPSIWIENAPFIIREAFAAGAPVIASNLGGMAEMVRDGIDGRLFPPGDSAALAAILEVLARRPDEIERLRTGIRRPLSIREDAANCRAIYQSLARRPGPAVHRPPRRAAAPLHVTAVVLNYRTPDQTALAVRSIRTSLEPVADIIVVDNGSGKNAVERLEADLPGVTILAEPRNVGFPAGCNAGIRAALARGADAVLLVNSDAVLAPDASAMLHDVMAADRSIGLVAPVLLSREEPDRIASAGIGFSTRTGRMRHRAAGLPVSLLPPGALHDVDAASGCVLLIARDVFARAGLFDDEYFFSFEDIDFCLRARDAGFRTVVAQGAFAYHEGGRSIGRRSARRVYFATRNHLRLSRRIGSRAAALVRAPLVVGLNAAYVLVSPDAPLGGGLAAVARGVWHHVTRRYGSD